MPPKSRIHKDDGDVWAQVAATVAPLPNNKLAKHKPAPKPTIIKPVPRRFPAPPAPDMHAANAAPDPNLIRQVRNGRRRIDAKIDLHGHTQDAAHHELNTFIRRNFALGRRVLLVVTGKGDKGQGVLRVNVPRWLTLMREVMGCAPADIKHGGDGALYVFLRKHAR